jgi:glycosyltransferase involved in cell wall biosynthesis
MSSTRGTQAAPLRIALVLWSGAVGGAETFSVALARTLRVSSVDAHLVMVTHAGPLGTRCLEAGVPFSELRLARGRAALWHPRLFARAVAAGGTDGAVLVAGGFLALALRVGGYRGRIAAVEHGAVLQTDRMSFPTKLKRRVDRLSGARFVDLHVAVSDFVRARIDGGARPAVTIPNGIDLDVYRPPPSQQGKEFVVGCMSRLIPGKGVEDVLVAGRDVLRGGARLRIAGDGPERGRLERLAEMLGIRESVEFVGWVQGESEVAAFWGTCDVAVAAPNDLIESFGLAAVEAMACAVPVVATRVGALPETVLHQCTGFIVGPRDPQALAAALCAYRDDPSLAKAHGAAGRKWCEERFDIRRCAQAYASLFHGAGAADRELTTATHEDASTAELLGTSPEVSR